MRFIYCLNPFVAKDLELLGLTKLGDTVINGNVVPYFANSKEIILTKFAKNEILLSNQLFFTQAETVEDDSFEDED